MFESIRDNISQHIISDLGMDYFDVVERVRASPDFHELNDFLEKQDMSSTYALQSCTKAQRKWWDDQLTILMENTD